MATSSAWGALLLAGILEVAFAMGLKTSAGVLRPWTTAGTVLALIGSLSLLSSALQTLPVGTAYAVWTGIGAAGTALLGILLFGEPSGIARLSCLGLIVAGVAGLKIVG